MKLLLVLIFAPLIAFALLYFLFPGRLVAFGRWALRKRGGTVQKRVTVDGRVWPYLEGGDPTKPLLLLVHGFAGDKDNWSMIAPYITRDYHVIAPDLPGFGENERNPALAYDIAAQTARLKKFADALGLEHPHVAGNSMGGWIALRYAIDYPDALATLTLLDNAGINGANESDLQKQAANEDYNPLVLASLEDADRLVAMVVHKPPYLPKRLKPVFYADALGVVRPHIAGNSMGGWIALRYAIDYPDALASLILLDNAGVNGAEESELQKQAASEDYNPLVLAGLEDADRLVAMVVHKPPHIPSRLKPVLYADALKYRDQLDAIFWVIAIEGRDHPLNDRLGEVKVPTLILWGRHDKLLDVSCVPVLEAGIAGSRSRIFEHIGHVPMIEDPKATAEAMQDFLARL